MIKNSFNKLGISFALMIFFFFPSIAFAGVTIHYSGIIASQTKIDEVLKIAEQFSTNQNWQFKIASKSIVIFPGEWCEPLELSFQNDILVENFVKTQFAGPEVHKMVVELLKKISPYFQKLEIEDEGEYWETNDTAKLKENIESVNKMILDIKTKKPSSQGPIKLPSGRFVDIVEDNGSKK